MGEEQESVVVAVREIVGRGTLGNTVEHMAIVDTMVSTAGPKTTVIKLMLNFFQSNEESPRNVICPPDGKVRQKIS